MQTKTFFIVECQRMNTIILIEKLILIFSQGLFRVLFPRLGLVQAPADNLQASFLRSLINKTSKSIFHRTKELTEYFDSQVLPYYLVLFSLQPPSGNQAVTASSHQQGHATVNHKDGPVLVNWHSKQGWAVDEWYRVGTRAGMVVC